MSSHFSGAQGSGVGMMDGGYEHPVSCASCHGANGAGGLHRMHMRLMTAPGELGGWFARVQPKDTDTYVTLCGMSLVHCVAIA